MLLKSAFFIVSAVILLFSTGISSEPNGPRNHVAHDTGGGLLKSIGNFVKRCVIATAEFLSTTAELGVKYTVRFARATKQMISSAAERFWNPTPRPVRATDKQISTAVEHMTQVARLTAGIALQTALIDEKQTADELISELLHFGSVTPSQMTSIDSNRLRNTLKSLKELPNAMVDSKEVKEVEKKLELMEELRKLVQVAGDGSKWDGKDEFMQEMDNIEKKGVNVTQFSTMAQIMSEWKVYFNNVKKTNLAMSAYQSKIEELKTSTESIFNLTKEWDHSTMNQLKYPTIESAEKSLSSLSTLVEAVQKAIDIQPNVNPQAGDGEHFAFSKGNIELLSTLSASLSSVLPDLQTIESILRARESPVSRSLMYPGFANGYHDLETLFDDFSGEWLQKVVDKERMIAALRPIKTLIPAFKRADKAFESFGSKDLKSLSNLLQPVNEVRTVSTDSNRTITALEELWKCKASFNLLDKPSADSLQQFISMARKLDVQFGQLRGSIDTFVKAWNKQETINLLNDVSGLFVFGDDAVLNNTIETLRASQSMKKLNDVIDLALEEFGSAPKSVNEIKKQAANVAKNSTVVDDYIKSLSKFQPLLKCLHDIGQNRADLVTSGIAISRKFRTAKGNVQVVESGETVVDGVLKAADTFSNLKDAIGKTKGSNSQESDVLRTLPDPEIHSRVLGSATRGITAMKRSLDRKAKADLIINNAVVVEAQLASVSLDQEDKKNSEAVVELKRILTTMYQQLEDWRNQDLNESSTVLESYSTLFTSAQNVAGVGGNLWNMSSSVEKLSAHANDPTARKQLQEVQKALATLASIGIDFVSYTSSFAGSKDTLTALDTFFVNQRVKTTTVAPSPVTVPLVALQKIQFTQQPIIETTTFAYLSFIPFWVWVILAVVVIIALLAICVCIGWFAFVLIKKYISPDVISEKEETDTAPVPNAPATNSPANATKKSTGETGDIEHSREEEKTAVPPSGTKDTKDTKDGSHNIEQIAFLEFNKENVKVFAARLLTDFEREENPNQLNPVINEEELSERQADIQKYCAIVNGALTTANQNCPIPVEQNEPKYLRCRSHPVNIQLGGSYHPLKDGNKYFTHDFYHANHLTLPNRQVFILMQSPHVADDIDNVEEFWYKVITEGVKIMLSCVHSDEFNKPEHCAAYYTPAEYYSEESTKFVHKGVTVICKFDDFESVQRITKFKLEVTFRNFKKHELTLLEFDYWPKGFAPQKSRIFSLILPQLYSQHPVVIHSPHGCGRAGTVAFMEHSRQQIIKTGNLSVYDNLKAVRDARAGAVETAEQLAYAYTEVIDCAHLVMRIPPFLRIMKTYIDIRNKIYEDRQNKLEAAKKKAEAAEKNAEAAKDKNEFDDLGDDDVNPLAMWAIKPPQQLPDRGTLLSPGAAPAVTRVDHGATSVVNEANHGAASVSNGASVAAATAAIGANSGDATVASAADPGALTTGSQMNLGAVPAASGELARAVFVASKAVTVPASGDVPVSASEAVPVSASGAVPVSASGAVPVSDGNVADSRVDTKPNETTEVVPATGEKQGDGGNVAEIKADESNKNLSKSNKSEKTQRSSKSKKITRSSKSEKITRSSKSKKFTRSNKGKTSTKSSRSTKGGKNSQRTMAATNFPSTSSKNDANLEEGLQDEKKNSNGTFDIV